MSPDDSTQHEYTDVFFRMAGLLFSEETRQSSLDLMCRLAHETIPGTAGAGVTLIDEKGKSTAAYSDELVTAADAVQYEMDEGPCLSSIHDKAVYRIDDMSKDDRWPRWAAAAAVMGMGSSLSIPLIARDRALGAVKIYSKQTQAYDAHDEYVMQMFVDQAAIVLANVESYISATELTDQLRDALESRDVIGKSIGILMEREGVGDEDAFLMLRITSQNSNVKLRDIANELVEKVRGRGGK